MPAPAPPARSGPDFTREAALGGLVCGVDEAGRGPWAGPVTAAAVILDPRALPPGLDDSKRLATGARAALERAIRDSALAFAVIHVEADEIDRINILQATHRAMQRAVAALSPRPVHALVDGNRLPDLPCPASAIVGGDGLSLSIAAASILAKTARDRRMQEEDCRHPGYGFAVHKGYGVPAHARALEQLGPCPLHRRSFRPVARWLAAVEDR